jgi:hypothetical protein
VIIPGTGEWAPGIGDPSVMGWVTVAAYVGTAVLCGRNIGRARGVPREQGVWIALTVLLLLLAVNKQLDLQSWFTVVGREMARRDGWYGQRATVQVAFIAGLAAVSIGLVLGLRFLLREAWRRHAVVIAGLALLLSFVVTRAATFHHVDRLLGMRFGVLSLNHLFELGSIAVVALGAWLWRPPQPMRGG